MPLNPSGLSSPQLMEVMMLIKQHNLFEEVHAVLSMNLISRKLIALGARDIVADPRGLQATDIHEAMERAMEAYVKDVLEKRRVN
jgi:hypothetical protein